MSRTKPRRQVRAPRDEELLLPYLRARQQEIIATIRRWVELESPSFHKASVDRLGQALSSDFAAIGGDVRIHRAHDFGDHLQVEFHGGSGRPLLLLGHFDTVWDVGTLSSMPFRIGDGRLWGPGVLDMKTGIAQMLFAIEALRQRRGALPRPITVLLVTDEEVGSESSRAITERLARQSAAVLVLEPSAGLRGALKTARKGVGVYRIKVRGCAAHAGLNPENGASAVLELARQVLAISGFTDLKRGITVNPGVIRGGTRTNVIAADASAEVDVRVARIADAARLERRFRALRAANKRCKLEISGGINRPPLERSRDVAALFAIARGLARELGFALKEASVGGGSDGNFTAALGIPTLDGLGAVGEGAHAINESVLISEIPRRTALLARLIETV